MKEQIVKLDSIVPRSGNARLEITRGGKYNGSTITRVYDLDTRNADRIARIVDLLNWPIQWTYDEKTGLAHDTATRPAASVSPYEIARLFDFDPDRVTEFAARLMEEINYHEEAYALRHGVAEPESTDPA